MIRRPPRSTLFPYNDALPISPAECQSQVPRIALPRTSVGRPSCLPPFPCTDARSEEHTSELQSQSNLVCRLLLEKKKKYPITNTVYYILCCSRVMKVQLSNSS